MKRLIITGAVVAMGLALAGCSGGAQAEPSPTPTDTRTTLQKATSECIKGATVGMELMDAGKSVEMRTAGEKSPYLTGLKQSEVDCVLKASGASSAVLAKMGKTRALDGTRTDSWSNFEVSYSYHPNSGFAVILEEK